MASHPMSFFQDFWEMLKDDILQPLQNFHSQQVFEKSFNATYVALIPNKKGWLNCKDEGNFLWDNHWTRTIRWRHNEDGKFSVKVYKRSLFEMAESLKGPWKATWKSMAPTKVKCFVWLVVKKACLTHEAHQKKKLQIAFHGGGQHTLNAKEYKLPVFKNKIIHMR
ncbi:hypothetical protein MTR67_019229 [Solanum verrucosum]|uniref:Reverse transcriptase zinc-binding domain-containing protein n=1 Tax=Solanum verrucosum TaxID=315347 RepID=A0AAF0QL59_SOLVR|nr:hypothetical protein MTR67_019229 [Solanum verrucosum]